MSGLVDLTLGIYSMDGNCLLYEEKQAGIDLDESNGFFSVQVGSVVGDPKRTGRDPGKTLAAIFANGAQLRADHSTCPGGYTPASGESRRLRVTVQLQGGAEETLSPDLTVSPAPQAFVAETLQGLKPDNLIQAKTTVTQEALGTLTAGASSDASALHNHDGQYAKLSNSSSITLGSGQVLGLGSNNGTPADVRVGDTWFDSSDNTMKYWDGTQAVSVGSAAGAVTSFNSRTGAVTLSDSDVTAALGFTPANASTMTTALAGKEPVITAGTSSQYLKGDKSLGSFNADVRGAIGVAGPLSYDLTSGTLSMVNQGSSTTVLHGNSAGQPSFSAIVEGDLNLSDVLTGNATTARHGFLPKLGGGTTNFLREDGTWAALPAGVDLTTSANFGTAAAGAVNLGKAGQSTVLNGSVSVSSLKVADGSQGAGKVLTSDADGMASWVAPATVDVGASTSFGTTATGTVTIGKDGINTVLNGNVGIGAASGGAKLEVTGANGTTLKIVDTNQGTGKVLTSDADGVARWATLPTAPVTSVAGKTGVVTLSSGDISGLGAAATAPAGNLTEATSSVLTITGGASAVLGSGTSIQVKQANGTTSGYLSSTDWNTFNGKEPAITAGTSSQYLKGDKSLGSFEADTRAALSGLGPIDYNFTTGTISMLNKGTTTTVLHGNANGQPGFSAIVESDLSLSDVTTGDATTARHGFLPKLGSGATNFLREDGTWAALPSAPVASVAGKTGVVTLSTSDISGLGAAASAAAGNLTEATSSVLTITGGASAVLGSGTSIQVKQASSTTGGYLSSVDWNTFNNKQAAITSGTTAQYLRGDKSLSSFDADARAALSGLGPIDYNFTTGTISMLNKGTTTTVLHGNANGQPAFSAIVEGDLSLSDVTTGDATTARHGFLPKLPGGTATFLRADGSWAAAGGGGDVTTATNIGTAAAGTVTIGKAGVVTSMNGSVGIGTASPSATLTIVGSSPGSGNAPDALVVTAGNGASAQADGGQGGSIRLTAGDGGGADFGGNGGSIFLVPGAGGDGIGVGSAGNVVLAPNLGRVGIGTSAPLTKLDARSPRAKATTSALEYLFQTASSDSSNPLTLRAGIKNDATAGNRYAAVEVDDGGTKRHLAIQPSGGNVGIGTIAPGEKLEVNGNVKATAFVSTSDRRLKRDIAAIQDPLERVLRLTGATYNWKASGRPDMGLIAQNVEENFPELVATDSNGFKAVKYGNVVAPVIEALKEFWHKFTDDSDRKAREIAELKARVELLERRLEALEAKDGATEKK